MSRYIKLENIIAISQDVYGQFHRTEDEEEHSKAMSEASVKFINALSIDEVIEVEHSSTKDEVTTTVPASYLYLYPTRQPIAPPYMLPRQNRDSQGHYCINCGAPIRGKDWLCKRHLKAANKVRYRNHPEQVSEVDTRIYPLQCYENENAEGCI